MLALAAYPATMRQIPASGLIFDVSLDGPDDGVPVVLLHGFPQDHSCWDPIVADLVAAGHLADDAKIGYPPARVWGVPTTMVWVHRIGIEKAKRLLFTGDCLFPGGVGKTWQPGDFERLLGDVTTKLFDVYPDDTAVYPGHGSDTTLGDERPKLLEWEARGW